MRRDELIKAIRDSEMSPSEKRKSLLKIGVKTEYIPHQGKGEMARRVKKMELSQ